MRVLLGIVVLFFISIEANAQEQQPAGISGAQLVQYCKNMPTDSSDPANDWQGMACVSYLLGFTNAHEMTRAIQDSPTSSNYKAMYCAPSETSISDYQALVVAFGISHPEMLTQPAANFVMSAFMVSFPCPWFIERAHRAQGH